MAVLSRCSIKFLLLGGNHLSFTLRAEQLRVRHPNIIRGRGVLFGMDCVGQLLDQLQLPALIRSHLVCWQLFLSHSC